MKDYLSHRKVRVSAIAVVAIALGGSALTGAGGASAATASLVNPGFESGLTGWTVVGGKGKSSPATVVSSGRVGGSRLNHYDSSNYEVTTSQRVSGLSDGWWTASAWFKGSGADTTKLVLTGCGAADATMTAPSSAQDDGWVRVAVSAYVVGGGCTVAINTKGSGGAWASVDDVALEPARLAKGIRGGDVSGLAKNEAKGATYASAAGVKGDPLSLLAGQGMNLARLKVWVNPADGFNTTQQVVATAKRAQAAGMQIMIDFHYSDSWADPSKQTVPAAWAGHSPAQLTEDIRQHTTSVMTALRDAGVTPAYVQVGNEINPGMLWPWGQTWDVDTSDGVFGAQWANLASFLTAGSNAVKAVSPSSKVILHVTDIQNGPSSLNWWFDAVTARGVPFDVIGLSYYGYWHGSLANLQGVISTVSSRYDRDVLVVETAYPFTLADDAPSYANVIGQDSQLVAGYPATQAGQASNLRAVINAVASAPGGRGIGTVYWEPTWTARAGNGWDPADAKSGNAWENQALFDFNDRLLPAAAEFKDATEAAQPLAPLAATAPAPAPAPGPAPGPAPKGKAAK